MNHKFCEYGNCVQDAKLAVTSDCPCKIQIRVCEGHFMFAYRVLSQGCGIGHGTPESVIVSKLNWDTE